MLISQRLNLQAFRQGRSLSGHGEHTNLSEVAGHLSRREFLVLGGLAAASVPSLKWLGRPFRVQRDGNRVGFWLGEQETWVIDAHKFSGSPALSFRDHGSRILIVLRNAFFPGTELSASFRCLLTNEISRWTMHLQMDSGMSFRDPFIDWISGKEPTRSPLAIDNVGLYRAGRIRFARPASVEFRPDWKFRVYGLAEGDFEGLLQPIKSDEISFGLPHLTDESLTGQLLTKRSVLSMRRGTYDWHVPVNQISEDGWRLESAQNLFDSLAVETSEDRNTPLHTALFTNSVSNPARLRFFPGERIKDAAQKVFRFELESPKLLLTLGDKEKKSALFANFANDREWLHGDNFSVQVGAEPGTTPFELSQTSERLELNVSPALFQASAPGDQHLSSSLRFGEKHEVKFNWGNPVEPITRGLASINLSADGSALCAKLENCTLSVIRPRDLLNLEFQFKNLKLTDHWFKLVLEPDGSGVPAIIVSFPPQNIGEQAFYERVKELKLDDFVLPERSNMSWDEKRKYEPDLPVSQGGPATESECLTLPVRARIAEPSRLVFEIPRKIERIPFKLSALLDWNTWSLKVHPVALSAEKAQEIQSPDPLDTKATDCTDKPKPPDSDPTDYTSIEMPYRLMISPHKDSAWAHEYEPVDHDGEFAELWHTRLAIKKASRAEADEADNTHRTIRAIWSPDYCAPNSPCWPRDHADYKNPFRMSLDNQDRHELVHLTSNYCISIPTSCDSPGKTKPYVPGAVQVEQLMLTSLGGWLKSRGNWEPPAVDLSAGKILTVEEWRHMATMGRDQYVRVVYKGYLMPFGHRASLIKVTERKVQKSEGLIGAFLRQRMYIVVREHKKEFPAFGHQHNGRQFPWRAVEAVTLVSPSLDDPNAPPLSQSMFWPLVGGHPFKFRFRLIDVDGKSAECSLPVLFVDNSVAFNQNKSQEAIREYNSRDDCETIRPLLVASPTPTPKPTPSPTPSQTPVCPSPTPTPRPSPSPTPSPVVSPTPKPSPTATCPLPSPSPGPSPSPTPVPPPCTQNVLRRDVDFSGQKISFASSSKPGDTQYDVKRIKFIVDLPNLCETTYQCLYVKGQPFFYPEIDTAWLNPAAVRRITGKEDGITVRYDSTYLDAAFDPVVNRGEVFFVAEVASDLSFGGNQKGDQAGGVVTPNMSIVGFSRKNGPVGGNEKPSARVVSIFRTSDRSLTRLQSLPAGSDLIARQRDGKFVAFQFNKAANNQLNIVSNGRSAVISLDAVEEIFLVTTFSATSKVQAGEFDPLDYFGSALEGAKILGGISLWDIIKPFAAGALSNLGQAPKMIEESLFKGLGDLIAIEDKFVALINQIPPGGRKALSVEIQDVQNSFAEVKANANSPDLISQAKLQAQFIRAVGRLKDRIEAILKNPNLLLEGAIRDLVKIVVDYENMVVATLTQTVRDKWRQLEATVLASIQSRLETIKQDVLDNEEVFKALQYADQIANYVLDTIQVINDLRTELKTLVDIVSDPAKLKEVIGSALVSEISALAKLDDARRRLITLVEFVRTENLSQIEKIKTQLLDAFKEVQKLKHSWNPNAAEQLVQNFESLCAICLAEFPDAVSAGQVTKTAALQLVRQAAAAMRAVIRDADRPVLKVEQKIQRQLLTSLQQLQALITDPHRFVRATRAEHVALLNADRAALVKVINDLAGQFTIVNQALKAENLELLFATGILPAVLPDQVKNELAEVQASIDGIRAYIGAATGSALDTLVTYELQLFDLWAKYQDPHKLATDLFGLGPQEIAQLQQIANDYKEIHDVIQEVKASLVTLQQQYDSLIQQIPDVAKALLEKLTQDAADALGKVVAEQAEERLLPLEQAAIVAVTNLYQEFLRRVQSPLEDLKDLIALKDEFEQLLQSIAVPESITLSYDWTPEVKDYKPVFEIEKPKGKLTIKARVTTYFNGKNPDFSIDGELTNFNVNLIGNPTFITIIFDSFSFSSRSGAKPTTKVKIKDVTLGDQMEFVKKIQQLLSPSDGPFIELHLLSIRAGYRFAVPKMMLGSFLLQQLRLIVAVNLPLTGEPMRAEFAVSERDHPFLLSAGQYGGGGFLRMLLGLDGVELLEGAFEFGLVADISIGIASGSGFIVAGIYFSISKDETIVCGFVHAHGHLDVIGLISLDLDVLVQVCYNATNGNAEGEARIVVHIEYMFFSVDIELHAQYQFAGSKSGETGNALKAHATQTVPCLPEQTVNPKPDPVSFCSDNPEGDFKKYREAFAW
jgi:hypothetical protein